MKGQLNVSTPAEYLSKLEEPRRSEIAALDALIREHAPELTPYIQSGMLGYGPFRYQYGTGRAGEWCKIGLASNAASISLYASAADENGYVAEQFRSRLPKANIGKSCVRFKRLSDLDLRVVVQLVKLTARTGFGLEERRASGKALSQKKAPAKKAPAKKAPAKKAPAKKAAAKKTPAKKAAPRPAPRKKPAARRAR